MYTSEKRAAAAARKRFTLDPFSDHLIFVQVFRVSLCYHLCLENESLLVFIQSFNILNNSSSELITDTCRFLHGRLYKNRRIIWSTDYYNSSYRKLSHQPLAVFVYCSNKITSWASSIWEKLLSGKVQCLQDWVIWIPTSYSFLWLLWPGQSGFTKLMHMIVSSLQGWQRARSEGFDKNFCRRNYLSQATLEMMAGMR